MPVYGHKPSPKTNFISAVMAPLHPPYVWVHMAGVLILQRRLADDYPKLMIRKQSVLLLQYYIPYHHM